MIDQLQKLGVSQVVFKQRQFAGMEIEFEINSGRIRGRMQLDGQNFCLEDFTGIYNRLMDFQLLPELDHEPPNSLRRLHCQALHSTLTRWFEIAPARVLGRNSEIASNYSKTHQAQIIREHGFEIPETLITNDPGLVLDFRKNHKQVIYKSISCVRSIVQILEEVDLIRLDCIRWCPTLFQEYIEGDNIRVHTIGSQVFPTLIRTSSTDYRYSYLQGEQEKLKAITLSDELAERCLELSKALGIEFAGIDLKITPDNQVYCLEVNPGPAFSYYEYHTGQPIAHAVARYLAGMS